MHRLISLLAVVTISYAQGPDKQTRAYHLFFRSTAALDTKMADLERESPGKGQPLVRAVASKLGLTTIDAVRFFSLATRIDKQLAALDKEAAIIIDTAKKQRTAQGLLPPAPASLTELDKRRWQIVTNGITSIGSEISATVASKIDQYVRKPPSQASSVNP